MTAFIFNDRLKEDKTFFTDTFLEKYLYTSYKYSHKLHKRKHI